MRGTRLNKFPLLRVLAVAGALTLLFQNCGQPFKATDFASTASIGGLGCAGGVCPTAVTTCAFNGQILDAGGTVTAYQNSSGACASESRVCGPGGVLSGSFAFASCVGAPTAAPCLFNGLTVNSGGDVTAYAASSAPAGGQCAAQTRTCTAGVLSGTYAFASCAAEGATSCLFNGQTIPDGGAVNAFAKGRVADGFACAPQPRVCRAGVLTGAGEYASCVVAGKAPCLFDGRTIVDGQSVTAFASSNAACTAVTRTCADGVLSGAGEYASCQAGARAACLINGRTVADGGAITLFSSPVAAVGQSCAVETRTCAAGVLSGSAASSSCFARPAFISAEYNRPATREGLADMRLTDEPRTMDVRYAKFREMGIGFKIYNYWWSGLEDAGVASQTTPVTCPVGQMMVPASEAERAAKGYHRYRCINSAYVAQFDRLLTHDAAFGIQSGAVIWSAPTAYQYPNCGGGAWAGATLREGCVPREDAMDDFEDVVNFLASRYDGRGGNGKISHFVIWNENASALWFDYSPVVPNKGMLNAAQQDQWISKYASMLTRAHQAVQRNTAGVMLDVSTDLIWTPRNIKAGASAHIGTQALIDGLWAKLGTNVSWSVAVHPYGDIDKAPPTYGYNFANVQDLVAGYQANNLRTRGLPADSLNYPQAFLLASEQGWTQSQGIDRQAKNVCWAQEVTLESGYVLSQTHNYFQSIEPQDQTGGTSGQGAFFGLLPSRSAIDLSDMASFPTGAAYLSTNPAVWGQDAGNYCCQNAGVGCRVTTGTKPVFRALGTNHFYSTAFGEGPRAGMKPEVTAFTLYAAPGSDLIALFRCRGTTGDYLISNSPTCEGYVNEGALGYAHQTAGAGLVPLYRKVSIAAPIDHLMTLVATEGGASYRTEAVLGYVPAP